MFTNGKRARSKVSCIIPAYNEGPRILGVLGVVKKQPLIDEIIVVNDGSKDDTSKILKRARGIRLIDYSKNRGKSYAVMRGILAAEGDILMLIDADLVGLTAKNLRDLIRPVLSGKADVSISLRKNSPFIWRVLGLDYISGERVFHKTLLGNPRRLLELRGFGLEVFMNKKIIKNRYKIKVVRWANVISPFPNEKYGFFRGYLRFFSMIMQIFNTVGFFGSVIQIVKMSLLKTKKT